jgi:CheY-like chemotaxis protein
MSRDQTGRQAAAAGAQRVAAMSRSVPAPGATRVAAGLGNQLGILYAIRAVRGVHALPARIARRSHGTTDNEAVARMFETRVIVIIEVNEAVSRLIQEELNDVPGYCAIVVRDAAVSLVVISAVQPDLVIVETNLPGISGFELADLLRHQPRTANLPALLITAAPAGESGTEQLPALSMPADLPVLLHCVHRLFGRTGGASHLSSLALPH